MADISQIHLFFELFSPLILAQTLLENHLSLDELVQHLDFALQIALLLPTKILYYRPTCAPAMLKLVENLDWPLTIPCEHKARCNNNALCD